METILQFVIMYSAMYGVDPTLVMSVIQQESSFRPAAVGQAGEIGLMQLMPQYFPVPRKKLFDPKTNIELGVKHLAEMRKQCVHKADNTYLVCYNLGVEKGNSIRYPKLFPYYKKVMANYAKFKRGK